MTLICTDLQLFGKNRRVLEKLYDMEENQRDLQNQFRNQQEKYVYHIITLSVSAIGFSIFQTTGTSLEWAKIPLGMAVIFWSVSIYCGMRFLKIALSTLFSNVEYFNVLLGKHPEVGNDSNKMKYASMGIWEAIGIKTKKGSDYFQWQEYSFFLGIIFFIFWHIWEMYQFTISS